jgi:hypothetical protein
MSLRIMGMLGNVQNYVTTKLHWNGNLGIIKLVSNSITAPSPAHVNFWVAATEGVLNYSVT